MAGLLGVLLADRVCHRRFAALQQRFPVLSQKKALLPLFLVLLLAGLWLGGYPSYAEPAGAYRLFSFLVVRNNGTSVVLHIAGAFLILAALHLWHAASLPSPLSTRPFAFLGRNCYPIFMLHMLWIEYLGYYLMDRLSGTTGHYNLSAVLVYFCLFILLMISADLFHKSIERACDQLVSKICL